jgi:hypothetical protein
MIHDSCQYPQGTECSTKCNLDIYEEQSRFTLYCTAPAGQSDDVFHDLEVRPNSNHLSN